MKFVKLSPLIIGLFVLLGCICQQKTSNMNSENIQSEANYTIEYSASSRGIYKQVVIDKKTISTTQKRGATPTNKICNEKSWNMIKKQIEHIGIKNISTLKAPSKKFLFDGAAIAHLKISYKDSIYETPPFDHGNPPKDIAELVKEILSISEIIE